MYNQADQTFLNRPAIMAEAVYTALLDRCLEYCQQRPGHKMTLVFHGGEPTLLGARRINRLCELAYRVLGDALGGLAMQTNATRIGTDLLDVLSTFRVSVGVSLDGPPHVHDVFRVDHQGRGTQASVIEGIQRLQSAGVFTRVLAVISPGADGLNIYNYFRSLGIKKMDFLFPDATHDSYSTIFPAARGVLPVANYLMPIFDRWYEEDDPEISITLFEDVLRSLLGGKPQTEVLGNEAQSYLVVDSDGSIQANDVFRACGEEIYQSGLSVFEHGFDNLAGSAGRFRELILKTMPLAEQCLRCDEVAVCQGGYPPHRFSVQRGFDNPSVWCRDIFAVISHIRRRLFQAGELPWSTIRSANVASQMR